MNYLEIAKTTLELKIFQIEAYNLSMKVLNRSHKMSNLMKEGEIQFEDNDFEVKNGMFIYGSTSINGKKRKVRAFKRTIFKGLQGMFEIETIK